MSTTKTAALQKTTETKAPLTLKAVGPETLSDRINRIHNAIARRAFEIFEGKGAYSGGELDDWFKAESELLLPVPVTISESGEALQIEADVPGFDAKDLEVNVEGQRLTISGKKETSEEKKKGTAFYKEQRSNEILRVVDLPAEIDTAKATATLKNGVLHLTLTKGTATKSAAKVEVKAV